MLQAFKDLQELMERMAHQALKERRARRVPPVLLVHRDQQALTARMVSPAHKVPKVLLGPLVLPVPKDLPVLTEPLGRMVSMARPAPKVRKV